MYMIHEQHFAITVGYHPSPIWTCLPVHETVLGKLGPESTAEGFTPELLSLNASKGWFSYSSTLGLSGLYCTRVFLEQQRQFL